MQASRVTIERLGNPRLAAIQGNNKSLEGLTIAITALAKDLVPRDTGELQNTVMGVARLSTGVRKEYGFNQSSGHKAPEDQRLDLPLAPSSAVIGTGSDHWYPEFGTRRMVAQPFLRPAVAYFRGGEALSLVAKFCRDEMIKQFKEGKRQFTEYKSGETVPEGSRA